jgi:succinate dehydrogenase / fumarate reductase cytochrome b subunit
VVGLAILAWWLLALAGGEQAYEGFTAQAGRPVGMIVLAGLTWAFWQHFFSGLRHLVLDTGAGYELRVNRFWAVMTLVGSLFATALTWYFLMGVGK